MPGQVILSLLPFYELSRLVNARTHGSKLGVDLLVLEVSAGHEWVSAPLCSLRSLEEQSMLFHILMVEAVVIEVMT